MYEMESRPFSVLNKNRKIIYIKEIYDILNEKD